MMLSEDRLFTVEIVDSLTTAIEDTHFIINPDSQIIAGDSTGGMFIIDLLKTDDMLETEYTLGIKLSYNDEFSPAFSKVYCLRFSDFLAEPDWWYPYTNYAWLGGSYPYIGEFSVEKCLLWMEYNDLFDGTDPLAEYVLRYNSYTGYWLYDNAPSYALMYGFTNWLEAHPDAPLYDENGDLIVNTLY